MAVMGTFLAGCAGNSEESIAEGALGKKYGETFHVTEVYTKKLFSGYFSVQAYSEKNPEILFKADVDSDGGNVSDNYVSRTVCRAVAAKVEENIAGMPGYYYIYAGSVADKLGDGRSDISIEDFTALLPENKIMISVFFAPEGSITARSAAEPFSRAVNHLETLSGSIRLYITGEEKLREIQEYLDNTDSLYNEFEDLKAGIPYISVKYEKETLAETEERLEERIGGML